MNCLIQHGDDWLCFSDPVEVLTARTPEEVFQCLEKIEQSGLWAAGFVSYEAAGAFDDALKTHAPGDLPLLQFGLFQGLEKVGTSLRDVRLPRQRPRGGRLGQPSLPNYELGEWKPSVSRGEYAEAIASIKERIAAGDTYQVNYTFRLTADFKGDPFAFFCDLTDAQQGGYGAYIETDDFMICSASPELFFKLKDGVITSRPMKGTLPRGLIFSNDWKQREALLHSAKDRAENIMIVDMIRNDIGRIAEAGSVETLSRFDVEKYPTVWQMTSTVQGKLCGAGFQPAHEQARMPAPQIFKALFPCASITGAPKAKTMEIIQSLERTACGHASPRGIYTGSIGFIDPDGNAQFNVAIRTAVIQDGKAEYGIGGGIVWDSDADAEYREALSKAAILPVRRSLGEGGTKKMPQFHLLETMLWEDGEIFLLERHLKRMAESAAYFDFECNVDEIRDHLRNLRLINPTRIRLLLSQDGEFEVQCFDLKRLEASSTLAIANEPVDSVDVFLYHKTTNRSVYEKAKADFPDADDVLLFNERGEVTESCIANVVIELDGRKITPPVECGVLAGTFRDELLDAGEIEEGIITLDDLNRADAVWLINSVRRWRPGIL